MMMMMMMMTDNSSGDDVVTMTMIKIAFCRWAGSELPQASSLCFKARLRCK